MLFELKTKTRALKALGASLGLALLLGGCTTNTREGDKLCNFMSSSCINIIVPPKLVEAGGIKNAAIVAGTGQGAASMATQFESRLSRITVNDQPYYHIVPANDPSRDGLFEVNVTTWAVRDEREVREKLVCPGDNCKKMVNRKLNCTVRKATVGALFRLKDKSGKLLATRDGSGVAESEQCPGEEGGLASAPEVLGQASDKLLDKIQDELGVRSVVKRVALMDDTNGIDPANVGRFKSALDFAKGGRMDRACPMLEELSESETRSVAVFYNAGFCAQVKGDWRQAHTLYAKADARADKPVDELKRVLEETRPYTVKKR
jgi:hypothetical protein